MTIIPRYGISIVLHTHQGGIIAVSWKVLEICKWNVVSTDSQKMKSVITLVAVATASGWDGEQRKDPTTLISLFN